MHWGFSLEVRQGAVGFAVAAKGGRDPSSLSSALLDTGKGFWNAGLGAIESGANLLSGAIPGGADYYPFLNDFRGQYDTPAFGQIIEVLTGIGALKVLGELRVAPSTAPAGEAPLLLEGPAVLERTPGGRIISEHAAERMTNPPAGRAPMSAAQVDGVLDGATNIRKMSPHPLGDTLTIQNKNMPGSPQVVVDAATGERIITVISPKLKN